MNSGTYGPSVEVNNSEQAYILIFKKSRAKNPLKKPFKPAGIRNDGSTCYFNSCLQISYRCFKVFIDLIYILYVLSLR